MTNSAVYKSKWGYHPCDRETFLKLKEANKLYERALRQIASWYRWQRKEPQNRVMRARIRNTSGQVVGFQAPVPMGEPNVNNPLLRKVEKQYNYYKGQCHKVPITVVEVEFIPEALLVPRDYANARRPVAGPEGVDFLGLSREWLDKVVK